MKTRARLDPPVRRGSGRVRIIAGRYRRTPLPVLDAPGLRPTPDRVRETVFNWIDHLVGDVSSLRALDLFAGSGALGFEIASRGAAQVLLVDSSRQAAEALAATQRRLRAEAVTVLQADWRSALARLATGSFDLVFLDPPFDSGLLPEAIEAARRVLAPGALLYAEGPETLDEERWRVRGLELVRSGRAGAVHFHLLRAQPC